ncbi:MAG: 2Fe-2S iron-sulfur cluster-binding protein [Planctomycetota bacterium]
MPKVTYITPAGDEVVVENAEGNLMTAAVENQVTGIDGDCGGVCSCATCHIHVDPAWTDKVGPASEAEEGMLEFEDGVEDNSRLGCQVKLTSELDGLVVRVVGR